MASVSFSFLLEGPVGIEGVVLVGGQAETELGGIGVAQMLSSSLACSFGSNQTEWNPIWFPERVGRQ